MDYGYLAILLLLIALALLVAEIFLPSGGLITVVMLLCLVGSVASAFHAWWGVSPGRFWTYVASVLFLVPAVFTGALWVFPRTSIGKRILLEPPSRDEVMPVTAEEQHLTKLIGKTGRTLSLLNPGGLVLIEGERLHCKSLVPMIESGEMVEIVAVDASRVVVRPFAGDRTEALFEEEDPEEAEFADLGERQADEPPLDFEVPQS